MHLPCTSHILCFECWFSWKFCQDSRTNLIICIKSHISKIACVIIITFFALFLQNQALFLLNLSNISLIHGIWELFIRFLFMFCCNCCRAFFFFFLRWCVGSKEVKIYILYASYVSFIFFWLFMSFFVKSPQAVLSCLMTLSRINLRIPIANSRIIATVEKKNQLGTVCANSTEIWIF